MNKLLIICKEQFGYHTDIYKWCENLRYDYDIEVVTFNGRDIIEISGITNHYVSNKGNRIIRGLRFLLICIKRILFFKGVILVCYFKEARWLKKVLPWKKMILDIRTLDISNDKQVRNQRDSLLQNCVNSYDFVTVISEGLKAKLSLPPDKSSVLPLGADVTSDTVKKFDQLRLLYIGTLSNREIHKTIEGLSIALKNNSKMCIHYDIIGDGLRNELEELKQLVLSKGLAGYVTLHGFVQHNQLKPFLDRCNVGVSFVPLTEYYQHQPVTKSYEYILSGLYTIATGTYCNKEIICNENGIIIDDTSESFADSIISLYENRHAINARLISNTLVDYTWKNIVNNKLKPILKEFSGRYLK